MVRPIQWMWSGGIRIAIGLAALLAIIYFGRNEAQLRIYNSSTASLENLTVLFPKDEVRFGDVPAQSVTPYATVKRGVGPSAAFKFIANGVEVNQRVIDFFGWRPMRGTAFTYRVQLEPDVSQPFLNIMEVVKDK